MAKAVFEFHTGWRIGQVPVVLLGSPPKPEPHIQIGTFTHAGGVADLVDRKDLAIEGCMRYPVPRFPNQGKSIGKLIF